MSKLNKYADLFDLPTRELKLKYVDDSRNEVYIPIKVLKIITSYDHIVDDYIIKLEIELDENKD